MNDTRPRCPGCHALVVDGDFLSHAECLEEMARDRHDETDRDDYTEQRNA